jgi:tetratricopeptide (TPR) repeat protein
MLDPQQTLIAIDRAIQANEPIKAKAYCHAALRTGLVNAKVYGYLATLALKSRCSEEAIEYLEKLIDTGCDNAANFVNLGISYYRISQLDKAEWSLTEALKRSPALPQAHYNLALVQHDTGRIEEAKATLHNAIREKSDYILAYQRLSSISFEQGEFAACAQILRRAISIDPRNYELLLSYGVTARKLTRRKEAQAVLNAAIDILPRRQDAYFELAMVLLENQTTEEDIAQAMLWLIKGLQEGEAQDYEITMNLVLTLLRYGHYAAAFPYFETRLRLRPQLLHQPELLQAGNEWRGVDDSTDEVIIVTEQGYGDIFQFLRYALSLARYVPKVSIAAEQKLQGLLRQSHLFDHVYTLPIDVSHLKSERKWISVMSLPGRLSIEPGSIQVAEPYLSPQKIHTDYWRPLIRARSSQYVVGLHWQGNPKHEHGDLKGRSFPLERYSALARYSELSLVSLQKGAGSEQMETCTFRDRFVDCQNLIDAIWDFEETMAIIDSCDLVISSDSAVVHLAGAMGKPTWVLLSEPGEWRWGLDPEKTHWYSTLRLFRQRSRGDWQGVMEKVAAAIAEELQKSTARPNNRDTVNQPIVLQ